MFVISFILHICQRNSKNGALKICQYRKLGQTFSFWCSLVFKYLMIRWLSFDTSFFSFFGNIKKHVIYEISNQFQTKFIAYESGQQIGMLIGFLVGTTPPPFYCPVQFVIFIVSCAKINNQFNLTIITLSTITSLHPDNALQMSSGNDRQDRQG